MVSITVIGGAYYPTFLSRVPCNDAPSATVFSEASEGIATGGRVMGCAERARLLQLLVAGLLRIRTADRYVHNRNMWLFECRGGPAG